jgi:hypothetical protein
LALPLALMLVAVVMCAGVALALSRMDLGFGGLVFSPDRPTAVAGGPEETVAIEPTATAQPSDTPQPTSTPEPSPTPAGPTFELLLVKFGADYLIVANNGEQDFPLAPLQLGDDVDAIPGFAWGIDDLEPGDCVVAMKANRRPNFPNDPGCAILGVLEGHPSAAFWDRSFGVYYENERVGECPKNEDTCILQIPIFR